MSVSISNVAHARTLSFHNTQFNVINRLNQIWLTSSEIAQALGYASEKSISNLYSRNVDEFAASMTTVINSVTITGRKPTRVFSLRGAHLIAMFARTPLAKDFRKWVLDVLDREVLSRPAGSPNPVAVAPVAPVAPTSIATPRFRAVKFYEDTLYLAPFEGRPYTTLEHIVRGIGLDWPEQHECILHDRRVREHLHVLHLGTENGRSYGGICLPLNALAFWLFRISSDKVADPEVKRRLRTYRYECRESLIYYWNNPPAGDAAKATITWVKPAATLML